jgi:sporulation-control protein spo0M
MININVHHCKQIHCYKNRSFGFTMPIVLTLDFAFRESSYFLAMRILHTELNRHTCDALDLIFEYSCQRI